MIIYQVLERIQPHGMGWPDPPSRSHGYFAKRHGAGSAGEKVAILANQGIRAVDIEPITVEGGDELARQQAIEKANRLLLVLVNTFEQDPWLVEYFDATLPDKMDRLRRLLRGGK